MGDVGHIKWEYWSMTILSTVFNIQTFCAIQLKHMKHLLVISIHCKIVTLVYWPKVYPVGPKIACKEKQTTFNNISVILKILEVPT